jgi:prepilin-type N-terminal cleavage/methylation domain-containing protein
VGDRRGLTLIELVLALTILAVAGALVTGAFTAALRAWQSGVRSGREELVARIVMERIATQLRATVETKTALNNEDVVAFEAGGDHLRFVTLAAGPVPVQVFYGLTGDGHLVYREYPWPDKEFFGEKSLRRQEVVAEVTGLTVKAAERTQSSGGSPEITPGEWSQPADYLPANVTVEIVVPAESGAQPRRYEITVPVLAGQRP